MKVEVGDITVTGMSFMAFHFMLDLVSCMNDKDKQQVCNDISTSVWEFHKITIGIFIPVLDLKQCRCPVR